MTLLSIFRLSSRLHCSFFFFNDTAPTEIYTLSLHDALPIYNFTLLNALAAVTTQLGLVGSINTTFNEPFEVARQFASLDRKSTRLNSSHSQISYAVFCLKKKIHNKRSTTVMDHVRMATTPKR